MPIREFASKNSDNNKAAFAKTGISRQLSLGYQLQRHYGLSSSFRLQENRVNTSVMEGQFYGINNPNSTYKINIESDNWEILTILAGAYSILDVNNKLHLNFGIMAGSLKTGVPKLTEKNSQYATVYYNANGTTVIEQDTTNTFFTRNKNKLKWSFAYSISTTAKYEFSRRFGFICSLDYLASKPKVVKEPMPFTVSIASPAGTTTVSNGVLTTTGEKEYRQPISTINFLIGITFKLVK